MRPILMSRVRAFLEKVERRRKERAAEAVEKWIKRRAGISYKWHRNMVEKMKKEGRKRKLTPRSKAYYLTKWREYLEKKAIEDAPAKLDLAKVHKFMSTEGWNPKCSNDILECYVPSVTLRKPAAPYPIHWPREIAMDLFSAHYSGFEGDWHRQNSCY